MYRHMSMYSLVTCSGCSPAAHVLTLSLVSITSATNLPRTLASFERTHSNAITGLSFVFPCRASKCHFSAQTIESKPPRPEKDPRELTPTFLSCHATYLPRYVCFSHTGLFSAGWAHHTPSALSAWFCCFFAGYACPGHVFLSFSRP